MRINNKIANYFFNRFDFIIRFFYCRLGVVSRVMNRLVFWKLYSSGDPAGIDQKFQIVLEFFQRNGVDLKAKSILEIGPGNSLINSYNLLRLGANHIHLVDKFPRYIQTNKQRRYWRSEINYFIQRYGRDRLFFLDDSLRVKPEFIDFTAGEITSLPPDKKYDVIFSQGVLEHMKDIRGNIEAMGRLLAPGGYAFHYINLLDHYNFNAPFLFYKYSDQTWNKWLTHEGVSFTNRWRYQDYLNAFQSAGLRLIDQKIERVPLDISSIHPQFRHYNDLDISMVYLLLKKVSE